MKNYIKELFFVLVTYFTIGCGSQSTPKAETGLNIQPVREAITDTAFQASSRIRFPVLDEKLLTDLDLLGKIWGFLKYHHPAVAKGNYNWDHELFRILSAYLSNQNPAQRDQILLRWIDRLEYV